MCAASTATLLLACPDRPGIVAAVAEFFAQRGVNILHADQHTEPREDLFVQRIEIDLAGHDLTRDDLAGAFAPLAQKFGMRWTVRFSDPIPRVAILVSKRSHCLYDLLARWQVGELRMAVPFVAGNHAELEDAAARFSVPFHHLPVRPETRGDQEGRLAELIDGHGVELIVLARYMQILSPAFVARYSGRVINIHHSFLPAFKGARPYHRAHDRGVKVIGATAHYATADLDEGPIIEQDVARVSHRDSIADLIRKGRDLEKIVLSRAVRLHLEDRILVHGHKTTIFD